MARGQEADRGPASTRHGRARKSRRPVSAIHLPQRPPHTSLESSLIKVNLSCPIRAAVPSAQNLARAPPQHSSPLHPGADITQLCGEQKKVIPQSLLLPFTSSVIPSRSARSSRCLKPAARSPSCQISKYSMCVFHPEAFVKDKSSESAPFLRPGHVFSLQ